jgi:hypothetical protein
MELVAFGHSFFESLPTVKTSGQVVHHSGRKRNFIVRMKEVYLVPRTATDGTVIPFHKISCTEREHQTTLLAYLLTELSPS